MVKKAHKARRAVRKPSARERRVTEYDRTFAPGLGPKVEADAVDAFSLQKRQKCGGGFRILRKKPSE